MSPLFPDAGGGELRKFLFEGLPVRGMLVRLTGTWREMLTRRSAAGGYPEPVTRLLGEMSAAATLMQANIKFNGALILQIQGHGPVSLAVAEVQPDLAVRATATLQADIPAGATLGSLLNPDGQARCAITLDPKDRKPGQQPYQGIVPLSDESGLARQHLSEVLEHYMRQSEQLDTRFILAADGQVAAGLLIQRLPLQGEQNLEGTHSADPVEMAEAYNRIAHLASTLTRDELLGLDSDTILRRLFWEEDVRHFPPMHPRFACTCSRERVAGMLSGLGRAEVDSLIHERGEVEVGCEFCGAQYRFDAVDAAGLFTPLADQAPPTDQLQ